MSSSSSARPSPQPSSDVLRGARLTLGAVLMIGSIWLASQAIAVLILLFVAILLGAGLEPIVNWLRQRLPVGRAASILLTYAGFFAAVILIAFLAVPTALGQVSQLAADLPHLLQQARSWTANLEPRALATSLTAVVDAASRSLTPSGPPGAETVLTAGLTVAEAVGTLATLLTVVFFWLTEHARLQRYALAFVPLERRGGVHAAWNDVEAQLGRWVRGQVTIMGTLAVGTGILYSVLGLPSALLLGVWAGLAEAVPLVGPILGIIPAILVAATVGPQMVGIVAVAYVIIQFIEGNILVPLVMRNTVGISPFLVIASLLIGGTVGGFAGAFLAVPIAAVIAVVLERVQAREVPVAPVPPEVAPADAAAKGAADPVEKAPAKRALAPRS